MLQIRAAKQDEYAPVRDFYYALIDGMKDRAYKPGWEKDIYPSQELLIRSIENGELYIGETDGQMVSCVVVNHQYNDGYKNIQWSVNAKDSELLVIHALGVHPSFSGQGIAKEMVQNVIKMAQDHQIKTIRLDVLDGNIPAEKAYRSIGFNYLETVQMFYEDTGWTGYQLFEYIV